MICIAADVIHHFHLQKSFTKLIMDCEYTEYLNILDLRIIISIVHQMEWIDWIQNIRKTYKQFEH